MAGLDDEEYAREDAARAEEEWGSELERVAEDCARTELLRELRAIKAELDGERERSSTVITGLEEEAADLTRRLAESYREKLRLDDDLEKLEAAQEAEIDEALRRQAAAVIRRVELSDPAGPELGAVLALVPAGYRLQVTGDWPRGHEATWFGDEGDQLAIAEAPTREAAILAATAELLGLDEGGLRGRCSGSPAAVVKAAMAWVDMAKAQGLRPQLMPESQALIEAVEQLRTATAPDDEPAKETCGTCANWLRDAAPESSAGARPCGLDTEPNPCPRHPASSCGLPGSYVALAESDTDPVPSSDEQLPGVTLTDNLIRSEGDG